MMAHLEGKIVLRDRIVSGRLNFDSHIREIVSQSVVPERYILPGFIDVHVHGGGRADTIDGVAAIETLSRFHLGHGTTTILPTTITAPWAEVMDALRSVAEVCDRGVEGSPHKLGAQPPFNIEPTAELVAEAVATGGGRVVTIAPKLEHAPTALKAFAQAGVRVSLGHTTTDFEGAERARLLVRASLAGRT